MDGAAIGAKSSADDAKDVQNASGRDDSKGKRRSKDEMVDYSIPKM